MAVEYFDKNSIIGINKSVIGVSGNPNDFFSVLNEANLETAIEMLKTKYEDKELEEKLIL